MMKKTVLAAGFAMIASLSANTASAHSGHNFPPYVIFIGWNVEPAWAGEPNTMDFYALFDKQGDGSCDTDDDCIPVDTSKGGKVEILPGGYVKLLYCGELPHEEHANIAPAHEGHVHCDHPLAETVIADQHHQLEQAWYDPSLYNSEYVKPTKPGVYAFLVNKLKIKKQGAHPAVVLRDQLFVCDPGHGDNGYSCIGELKEFPNGDHDH